MPGQPPDMLLDPDRSSGPDMSPDDVMALLGHRAARLKLRPTFYYYVVPFGKGRLLGYRPRRRGGVWHLKMKIDGRARTRFLAIADDLEEADGVRVLRFDQALRRAREIFGGEPETFFRRRDPDMLAHTLRVCPVGDRFTVGHALEAYLAEKKAKNSRHAFHHAVADANAYIVGDLAACPCDELDITHLRQWFRDLHIRAEGTSNFLRRARNQPLVINDGEADRLARRRANSVLIVLKAALNMAWRDGRIADDGPWRRLRPYPNARRARQRVLGDEEIRALLAAAPLDLRRLVKGALFTGCRVGELRELRPSNFNYRSGTLFVHATKTAKSRNIVLSFEAIAFFQRLIEGLGEEHPVFHRAGLKPWGRAHHTMPMRRASSDAGFEEAVVFHDLRHTYASRLLMAGVSPFVVADQLGHADCTQLIKTYGHVSVDFAVQQIRERSPLVAASAAEAKRAADWHRSVQDHPALKVRPVSRRSIG